MPMALPRGHGSPKVSEPLASWVPGWARLPLSRGPSQATWTWSRAGISTLAGRAPAGRTGCGRVAQEGRGHCQGGSPSTSCPLPLCELGPGFALAGPQSPHLDQRSRLGPDSARTWGLSAEQGQEGPQLSSAHTRVLPGIPWMGVWRSGLWSPRPGPALTTAVSEPHACGHVSLPAASLTPAPLRTHHRRNTEAHEGPWGELRCDPRGPALPLARWRGHRPGGRGSRPPVPPQAVAASAERSDAGGQEGRRPEAGSPTGAGVGWRSWTRPSSGPAPGFRSRSPLAVWLGPSSTQARAGTPRAGLERDPPAGLRV